jgi:DNA-binding MarR family transcriptional regulator
VQAQADPEQAQAGLALAQVDPASAQAGLALTAVDLALADSGLQQVPADLEQVQADPEEVAELMLRCIKRMRRLVDAALSEHGLSLSRSKVLGAIDSGPCNQRALASYFDLAPRTITELVDGLERDGMVERTTDPADRRARQVRLTPAGRNAHERAVATRSELLKQIFGPLGNDQLLLLAAALRQIDDELGDVAGSPCL